MLGAIEMEFTDGKGNTEKEYIVLPIHEHGHTRTLFVLPMNGGRRIVTADDVRTLWDAWVKDYLEEDNYVHPSELEAKHPGIAIY